MSDKHTVKIHFANEKAARHFINWLDGQGEQNYWDWMEYREYDASEEGDTTPITAKFDYFCGTSIHAPNLNINTTLKTNKVKKYVEE